MPYYEKEQVSAAQQVDLVSFLQSSYPAEIRRDGTRCRWERADSGSVEIFTPERRAKNLTKYPTLSWYDYSTSSGGDNIRYLTQFHGCTFPEAVGQLLRFAGLAPTGPTACIDIFVTDEPEKEGRAPAAAPTEAERQSPPERKDDRLAAIRRYLTAVRHVSPNLVAECINRRILYADERSNCVFIAPARENYFIIRGTGEGTYKFRKNSPGNEFWEYVTTEPVKKVYVCEAPIDALSLCQLLAKPKNCAFAAMGGLKPRTFETITAAYPKAEIFCAVDWDEGGERFAARIGAGKRLTPKPPYRDRAKDWNELLSLMLRTDSQ